MIRGASAVVLVALAGALTLAAPAGGRPTERAFLPAEQPTFLIAPGELVRQALADLAAARSMRVFGRTGAAKDGTPAYSDVTFAPGGEAAGRGWTRIGYEYSFRRIDNELYILGNNAYWLDTIGQEDSGLSGQWFLIAGITTVNQEWQAITVNTTHPTEAFLVDGLELAAARYLPGSTVRGRPTIGVAVPLSRGSGASVRYDLDVAAPHQVLEAITRPAPGSGDEPGLFHVGYETNPPVDLTPPTGSLPLADYLD